MQTLSQKRRKQEEMLQQEELQKVMRQINKATSYVQSDRMLKDLPKPVQRTADGIAHNEYCLAAEPDCISERQKSPKGKAAGARATRLSRGQQQDGGR